MEAAHGVQVVTVEEDHTYHLNEAELEKILMNESIKDLSVAVVSVAGAYRGGKSFLLNFFIRYLSASPSARSDGTWLSDESKELTGFIWQGGSVRITTGIIMWSEPFVITLPSGEKVAVLLMDTQGTFDNTSSVKDCSTIFALSSLLSSTQIYNIKTNINEEDLHELQLFADYGKLMKDDSGKAFQELEFLIRDWMNPWEYAYGQDGGEKYLANKFKTRPNQITEVRELRQHILDSFEKVTCFLMPHPGLGVANPMFKGKISEISQDFTRVLKELATSIFSPEKLCAKHIGGHPVKSCELLNYFKSYMTVFNSDRIPTPTNILQAATNAGLMVVKNQVRGQFEANMQRACGSEAPSMPSSEVIDILQRELDNARSNFKAKKMLGDREIIDKKLEELIQELSGKQNEFVEINRLKTLQAITNGNEAYKKAIEAVTKGKPLCVHALDLPGIHNDAVVAALNVFNKNRKIGLDGQDLDKDKFSQDLAAKYEELELTNDHNNKTMVVELKAEYFEYIMSQVKSKPNLCENSFNDKHQIAKSKALEEFEARRNQPNSHVTDVYKSNMIQAIELQFVETKHINDNINQEAFKSVLQYFYNISYQASDFADKCVKPFKLYYEHEKNVTQAFMHISPLQVCGSNNKTLREIMQRYYDDLEEINELSNERAVTRAFWVFKNKYDRLSDHWYWAFSSWETAFDYYREAREDAKRSFFDSRSGERSDYLFDDYLHGLLDRCLDYYKQS